MWKKADTNSDGTVSGGEAIRYMSFMRVAGMTVATEGTITQAEFMTACKAEAYKVKQAEAGAPLKGSNSFTEAQAKDRIIAQGMARYGFHAEAAQIIRAISGAARPAIAR